MKIRVHSRKDGFRRAGIAFARAPVILDTDELGAERTAQLEAEPMLVVEHLEQSWSEDEAPKGKGKEGK